MFILLSQIPDARATGVYLEITRCVIDIYLDKELDAFGRMELPWYAVFFYEILATLATIKKRIQAK